MTGRRRPSRPPPPGTWADAWRRIGRAVLYDAVLERTYMPRPHMEYEWSDLMRTAPAILARPVRWRRGLG